MSWGAGPQLLVCVEMVPEAYTMEFCGPCSSRKTCVCSLLALLLLVILALEEVSGNPTYHTQAWPEQPETECDRNAKTEALCQRCAKSTKSILVYPMCCSNTDQVEEWCERYLNFGIQ